MLCTEQHFIKAEKKKKNTALPFEQTHDEHFM